MAMWRTFDRTAFATSTNNRRITSTFNGQVCVKKNRKNTWECSTEAAISGTALSVFYVCFWTSTQCAVTFEIYLWCYLLYFNSLGLQAAFFVSIFSQFLGFVQLCFSPVSMDLLYCTLFALTSQSPSGKHCLVSLGPGTELQQSPAHRAARYSFTLDSCYHSVLWCGVVWEVYVFLCEPISVGLGFMVDSRCK